MKNRKRKSSLPNGTPVSRNRLANKPPEPVTKVSGAPDTFDPELPKSLSYRLHELTESLCLVRDSLNLVRQGKTHFLIPLYGQMRALLSRDGNTPLLLSLSEELGLELKLYHLAGVESAPPLGEELLFHAAGPPFTKNRILDSQEEVLLSRFLRRRTIRIRNNQFTVADIIGFLANKAGGAHYDKTLPRDFAEAFQFGLGIPVISDQLCQVAEIVFALGTDVLKFVTDFEIFAAFVFPKQKIDGGHFILKCEYPGTTMSIQLLVDQNRRLVFSIRDLRGASASLFSECQIDFDACQNVAASFHVDRALSSTLQVILNGRCVGMLVLPHTLEVRNDFGWYHRQYSVPVHADKDVAGHRLGLAEFFVTAKLSEIDRGRSLAYLAEREREQMVWFEVGGSGYSEPGTRDMSFKGEVKLGKKRGGSESDGERKPSPDG